MRTPRFDGRSVSRRREARVGKEVMDARRSDRYLPGHGVTSNRGKFASLPILAFVSEGIAVKHSPSALSAARPVVIAALATLLARPAAGQATTPAFVQGGAFSTGDRVLTTTVTLADPVAGGDLLVGWFSQYNVPGQVQVSDNVNGAWTRAPGSLHFMDDTGDIALYYRENRSEEHTSELQSLTNLVCRL